MRTPGHASRREAGPGASCSPAAAQADVPDAPASPAAAARKADSAAAEERWCIAAADPAELHLPDFHAAVRRRLLHVHRDSPALAEYGCRDRMEHYLHLGLPVSAECACRGRRERCHRRDSRAVDCAFHGRAGHCLHPWVSGSAEYACRDPVEHYLRQGLWTLADYWWRDRSAGGCLPDFVRPRRRSREGPAFCW